MSGMHVDLEIDGADELAAAFEDAPIEVLGALRRAVDVSAERLQRDWRANARKSSGRHGKRYPSSITYDVSDDDDGVSADIGPDRARLQGRMGPGFEYGSVNQPPHYDGAKAFAANEQRFADQVANAVEDATQKALG